MSTNGVPRAPLPVPRHVRVGCLHDGSARSAAIMDALRTSGRDVAAFDAPAQLHKPSGPGVDVLLVCGASPALCVAAPGVKRSLAGVVVVCCDAPRAAPPAPRPSAVESLARALPTSRVVGALQQFDAQHIRLMATGQLETDAPVTGDDREATDLTEALIDEIAGVTAVYAGPLRNAAAVEGIGALLAAVEADAAGALGFRLDPLRGLRFGC